MGACDIPGGFEGPFEPGREIALGAMTTLGIGGAARFFADVTSEAGLLAALEWAGVHGVGLFMLGNGSNLLICDEGVDALVLRFRGELAGIEYDERGLLVAGAGALVPALARRAVKDGFTGLNFLGGIPASVGGAVRMNAGDATADVSGALA